VPIGSDGARPRRAPRQSRAAPHTTLGDLALPDTGVILPHEHIFLDIARQQSDQQQEVQVED
jgi:predicted metal-dependent phosphotriesterase family hydrolase